MTRKNSHGSSGVDQLHALLQKHEAAFAKVQSHKTVIKAYENIANIAVATEIISVKQSELLIALDQLSSAGRKALAECTVTIQKLEGLNKDLIEENNRICSDYERLKLEFQRQIVLLQSELEFRPV